MNKKNVIGTLVIIFLQFNIVFAQHSFEISGVYSLTSETLTSNTDKNLGRQLFHSYGINGKKIFRSNVFIQSGMFLRNFGTSVLVHAPIAIVDDTPTEIGGRSIDIPINVGYYFLNYNKIRLGISLGLNNGFLLDQYHDYYGVIIETVPLYNDFIFQFNTSVEIGLKLTDNIILDIRPIFQRQLNSNLSDYKQSGMGCQFGISYAFSK